MTDIGYTIFELFINMAQGIVFVSFCYMFLGSRLQRPLNIIFYVIAVAAMFFSISYLNYILPSFLYPEIFMYCVIMLPYCFFALEGKWYTRLLVPIIIYVIYCCITLSYSLFATAVLDVNIKRLMAENFIYRIISVLAVNMLYIFVLFVIYKIYRYKFNFRKFTDFIIFLLLPILAILIHYLVFAIYSDQTAYDRNIVFLGIISAAMFFISMLVMNMMVKISKGNEAYTQNLIIQKEKEMYKSETEQASEYIKEISTLKHNMKNKIYCIGELINDNNIEEAKNLCGTVRLELESSSEFINTKNAYLNSIMNVVYKKSKENGIDFSMNGTCTLKNIEESDLITIVGNLCDNAIEAVKNYDEGEKIISVSFMQQGGFYLINVKNSIKESVLARNPNLKSEKKNSVFHGHGINTVKELAKKYDGEITFKETDGMFVASVMLNAFENVTQ